MAGGSGVTGSSSQDDGQRSFPQPIPPIWNNTNGPMELIFDWNGIDERHTVPSKGQALIKLDNGFGHEIVISEKRVTILSEPFATNEVDILDPHDGPVGILTRGTDK